MLLIGISPLTFIASPRCVAAAPRLVLVLVLTIPLGAAVLGIVGIRPTVPAPFTILLIVLSSIVILSTALLPFRTLALLWLVSS